MIEISIDEDLLPWIINALNSYEDDCTDTLTLANRLMFTNDLENLFEDEEDYED